MRQRILIDSGVLAAAASVPDGPTAHLFDHVMKDKYNFELYVASAAIPRAKSTIGDFLDEGSMALAEQFFHVLPLKVRIVELSGGRTEANLHETLAAVDIISPHFILAGDPDLRSQREYKGIGIHDPREFQKIIGG